VPTGPGPGAAAGPEADHQVPARGPGAARRRAARPGEQGGDLVPGGRGRGHAGIQGQTHVRRPRAARALRAASGLRPGRVLGPLVGGVRDEQAAAPGQAGRLARGAGRVWRGIRPGRRARARVGRTTRPGRLAGADAVVRARAGGRAPAGGIRRPGGGPRPVVGPGRAAGRRPRDPRPLPARRRGRFTRPGQGARGCEAPWSCPCSRRWWCRRGSGRASSPSGGSRPGDGTSKEERNP
jgi:hypothetical protein